MKKGIKRIQASLPPNHLVYATSHGLRCLRMARDYFRRAGSSSTLARVNFAISSAKGAVRAASYREIRAQIERGRQSARERRTGQL